MTHFVNVYENTSGPGGNYYTYRLYSGESEEELKRNIIESIKDGWGDVDKIDQLGSYRYPINSLSDIAGVVSDIIQDYMDDDYGDLHDYSLSISDYYTEINRALDFYNEYMEVVEGELEHYEDANFYFYGDYAIEIQNIFPYLDDLVKNYGVGITDGYIKRLYNILM